MKNNKSKIVILVILISLVLIMDYFVLINPNLNKTKSKGKLVEADLDLDCKVIDLYAKEKGITTIEAKNSECSYQCELVDLEPHSNNCTNDKFHCYCN